MTEIEVTDPMHPLFGHRFPVRAIGAPARGATHVFVAYREHMTLRIPLQATNLLPPRSSIRTKLTPAAVLDLLTLAEQCEVVCPPAPVTSGADCLQSCNSPSSMNSRRSSKR